MSPDPPIQIEVTILDPGPVKKLWMLRDPVFRDHNSSPYANVWVVECEGARYRGCLVEYDGEGRTEYHPEVFPAGPLGWAEFTGRVVVYSNRTEPMG